MERTVWDLLSEATERLEAVSESPQFDAELLLREVTGLSRSQLFVSYDRIIEPVTEQRFRELVDRRLTGESIAYVRGTKGFRTIELIVDRRVLVPRPETERFVDYALAWLRSRPGHRRIVDVGTGSGAISLALATELGGERDDLTIVATERYREALEVAAMNRRRLGLDLRVDLVAADLLNGLPGPFDLVLANLPYLRSDQRHPSIEAEPDTALFAGPDGFDYYRLILPQLRTSLAPGGLFVGEIDPDQQAIALGEGAAALDLPVWIEADDSGESRYLLAGER